MKRSSLQPKRPPRPDRSAEFASYAPRHQAASRAVMVTNLDARMSAPIPKAPPTKPGKTTPTVAEREWMDAITAMGCIACILDGHPGTPGAVHHLLRGGRRMGHMHTICLCDPGHHQNGQARGMVSRHPFKARFEAKYGPEDTLRGRTQALVGLAQKGAA